MPLETIYRAHPSAKEGIKTGEVLVLPQNPNAKYYYYTLPVASKGNTKDLIKLCKQLQAPFNGYTLSVDIIVQTVQAIGYKDEPNVNVPAYQDALGISNNFKDPFNSPAPSEP